MKKKSTTSKKTTRHGQIPDDWAKIGIQLPKEMAMEFREKAGLMGHGGAKIMATVAMSILLSLEDEALQTLCSYVRQKTWESSDVLERERVLQLVTMMMKDDDDRVPIIEPVWLVDRVVNPDLVQSLGKKPKRRGSNKS